MTDDRTQGRVTVGNLLTSRGLFRRRDDESLNIVCSGPEIVGQCSQLELYHTVVSAGTRICRHVLTPASRMAEGTM